MAALLLLPKYARVVTTSEIVESISSVRIVGP
jgi:hypothetical protein